MSCFLSLALLLGAAPAAFAQTSAKLVGNTGSTLGSLTPDSAAFSNDHAQAFTTGANAGGYMLTRVHLPISVGNTSGTDHPTYEVSIRRASGNDPGALLATLGRPYTMSATGTYRFTAPGDGLKLEPGTTYFVVVDVSHAGDRNVRVTRTNSDNQDANPAPGWSVGNAARLRGTGNWVGSGASVKMAVHGYALVGPDSGSIQGDRLTLTFPHALNPWSRPAGSAFRVVQGGTRVATGAGRASVSGAKVTVELDRVVPAGTAATVHYARPGAGSGPLWGPGGSGNRPPFAAPDFELAVAADAVDAWARFDRAEVNGDQRVCPILCVSTGLGPLGFPGSAS